jgi:hypothetical protein
VRDGEGLVIHLPSPVASLRHALPALLEGVIAPFALVHTGPGLVGLAEWWEESGPVDA